MLAVLQFFLDFALSWNFTIMMYSTFTCNLSIVLHMQDGITKIDAAALLYCRPWYACGNCCGCVVLQIKGYKYTWRPRRFNSTVGYICFGLPADSFGLPADSIFRRHPCIVWSAVPFWYRKGSSPWWSKWHCVGRALSCDMIHCCPIDCCSLLCVPPHLQI